MKTLENEVADDNLKDNQKRKRKIRIGLVPLFILTLLILSTNVTFAHCDSYDGPVIKDAIKALEINNVSLVLKWVGENNEEEITTLFSKTYKLKSSDKDIYDIVEKHFFETLVRLHREFEGAPYTGLKPAGSASQIVQMADNAILTGDVNDLSIKFTSHIEKVVKEKYNTLMELSKVKNESLEKGRAYVAAYVDYTHTLEGIHSILEKGSSAHSAHNE